MRACSPAALTLSPAAICTAATACAEDAKAHCNTTFFFGYKNGTIIACLRDIKDKLKPACREQVFKAQLDAAYDYR